MDYSELLSSPEIRRIHFIGIGGISMSGLAEILLSRGYRISGSDEKPSGITDKLEKMGAIIYSGHSPENITGADLVVYTAAVSEKNPELAAARAAGIICIDRATLLGLIMKRHDCGITVSGTHGKTTTTSMISMIMLDSGKNPTIHIGGELTAIGGTTRIGGNGYFIAEACEYCESFLKFYPQLAVILNIEFDHADYFKDISHVRNAFLKYMKLVPENGYVVANADDENITDLLGELNCRKVTYSIKFQDGGNSTDGVKLPEGAKSSDSINFTDGVKSPDGINFSDGMKSPAADWYAKNIRYNEAGCGCYTLVYRGRELTEIELAVPGVHNVSNSLAAAATCYILGCPVEQIKETLSRFTGTHRRFEFKGEYKGVRVIDDYAHHPSEIRATLKAAVSSHPSHIWCVFQPHTYSRTKSLLDEFAVSFKSADTVILADIYAAREQDPGDINSQMLADKMAGNGCPVVYAKSFESIVALLKERVQPGDIVITMGAGDIYKVGEMLLA